MGGPGFVHVHNHMVSMRTPLIDGLGHAMYSASFSLSNAVIQIAIF